MLLKENRRFLIPLTCFIAYFLFCYRISLSWYFKEYFEVYNIFFDTDPNDKLDWMSHGWGQPSLIHLFLKPFTLPVRLLERGFSIFFTIPDRLVAREVIALSICPFFSTLTILVFRKILDYTEVGKTDAAIFTLLFALSFSNLLFAVVIESYAISGFVISLLFLYYLWCMDNDTYGSPMAWLALAICSGGITITNICIFFIVFTVHSFFRKGSGWFTACRSGAVYSSAALVFLSGFYLIHHLICFRASDNPDTGSRISVLLDYIQTYASLTFSDILSNINQFFIASIHSIIATSPSIQDIKAFPNIDTIYSYNVLSFTAHSGSVVLGVIAISLTILMGIGLIKIKRDSCRHEIYLVSLLVILFNFCLHTVFGDELFMYTQHWILPLFLLLVPVLDRRRLLSILLLFCALIANFKFFMDAPSLIDLAQNMWP